MSASSSSRSSSSYQVNNGSSLPAISGLPLFPSTQSSASATTSVASSVMSSSSSLSSSSLSSSSSSSLSRLRGGLASTVAGFSSLASVASPYDSLESSTSSSGSSSRDVRSSATFTHVTRREAYGVTFHAPAELSPVNISFSGGKLNGGRDPLFDIQKLEKEREELKKEIRELSELLNQKSVDLEARNCTFVEQSHELSNSKEKIKELSMHIAMVQQQKQDLQNTFNQSHAILTESLATARQEAATARQEAATARQEAATARQEAATAQKERDIAKKARDTAQAQRDYYEDGFNREVEERIKLNGELAGIKTILYSQDQLETSLELIKELYEKLRKSQFHYNENRELNKENVKLKDEILKINKNNQILRERNRELERQIPSRLTQIIEEGDSVYPGAATYPLPRATQIAQDREGLGLGSIIEGSIRDISIGSINSASSSTTSLTITTGPSSGRMTRRAVAAVARGAQSSLSARSASVQTTPISLSSTAQAPPSASGAGAGVSSNSRREPSSSFAGISVDVMT